MATGKDEHQPDRLPPGGECSPEHMAGLTLLALALLEPPEIYECEHRDALRAVADLGLRRCRREARENQDTHAFDQAPRDTASELAVEPPSPARESSEAPAES